MPDLSAPTNHAQSDEDRPYAYSAQLARRIEEHWQAQWEAGKVFQAANPVGELAGNPQQVAKPKQFILDMFPYPSGSGLHVGHPLGYIATDVYGRFQRMTGHNVLHTLGFDAFGLPAEQYAVASGTHPRVTTLAAIANMRRQLRRLGLGHDDRRSVSTIDPEFYKWTQWIFIQVFNSWYDQKLNKARPITELIRQFEQGERPLPNDNRRWSELSPIEQSDVLNGFRLAYRSDSPVNWCPGLGTVLANEEVTSDGRSERGNFPVFKSRLPQWNMRITAYAERLVADLDALDWPESIKLQQRNWIGRSKGAVARFDIGTAHCDVYTTRPDTLFGATYVVLAPEHPLVDSIVPQAWPDDSNEVWTRGHATPIDAIAEYRAQTSKRTELDRQSDSKIKTGVFTGAFATNPVNGVSLPVFISDYVLMGYGTGAIMAVPAHDQRDFEFARAFGLPIKNVFELEDGLPGDTTSWTRAFLPNDAIVTDSSSGFLSLDGCSSSEAKQRVATWLRSNDLGGAQSTFRMRDWLFSRQRYWGEPFPIVYDEDGVANSLPESMLPLVLPEVSDYSPRTFDPTDADTIPEAPLSRNDDWVHVELDLGNGVRTYRRETNTMPNWAGSCWYELRYLDPTNDDQMVDPKNDLYWMGPREDMPLGGVDLYVGGAEHAVLHLLYARFWSKVLFDLGHVSSPEPFHKLYNQGMIQAYVYRDSRGIAVPAEEVQERAEAFYYGDEPVSRTMGKMGKSLKNTVAPDFIFDQFGADTLRLYEMSMGPLDVSRPWETRAVVGQYRLLQKIWRNIVDEQTGQIRVADIEPDEASYRLLHSTITSVRADMRNLRFNTAIAKITELNNFLTRRAESTIPRSVAEALILMLAPFAPHAAEELWHRLGHETTIVYAEYPTGDAAASRGASTPCAVQIDGKVRAIIEVHADIGEADLKAAALANERIAELVDGQLINRIVIRVPTLVNIVTRPKATSK